ncbi:MAG: hypothetical protein J6P12_02065 [Methanobrevibacter sp.]|nr:hypothetical protein [Methanobrevibacter sp.]
MNYADKIKVPKIIIVGEKDLAEDKVTVKDMTSGNQELVELDNLINYLQEV